MEQWKVYQSRFHSMLGMTVLMALVTGVLVFMSTVLVENGHSSVGLSLGVGMSVVTLYFFFWTIELRRAYQRDRPWTKDFSWSGKE